MGIGTIRKADHYCESKELPLIANRIISEVLGPLTDTGVWLAAIWLGGSLSISDTIRGARVLGINETDKALKHDQGCQGRSRAENMDVLQLWRGGLVA